VAASCATVFNAEALLAYFHAAFKGSIVEHTSQNQVTKRCQAASGRLAAPRPESWRGPRVTGWVFRGFGAADVCFPGIPANSQRSGSAASDCRHVDNYTGADVD